jgi:hypothetical protein
MEMLAVYFAILDNLKEFRKIKRKKKIIVVKSDIKSTIEQSNKRTGIKDEIMRRIYNSIIRILGKVSCDLVLIVYTEQKIRQQEFWSIFEGRAYTCIRKTSTL